MSFLVLLLVVWLEKFSSARQWLQRDAWWHSWLDKLAGLPTGLALSIAVFVPLAALGLVLLLLAPLAYGWLLLPVHLLVLLYSLGRGDLLASLGPFRDAWRRDDQEAALHAAERDLQVGADQPQALLEAVQGHLVWQAYQGFFAVIFWYALLGPLLALAYRLLALSAAQQKYPQLAAQAAQVRHALDWLPARLLALAFALVGNFSAVNRAMLETLLVWDLPLPSLLSDAGRAAAEVAGLRRAEAISSLDTLWQLLIRAALLWYACFAVWVLFI